MFRKSSLNGLYTPFGSPVCGGLKPSLALKKSSFRIPPSPFSQRELHLSHQASLSSGTRGCSWLRYSLRQSFGIVSGACAHKGLPMIAYAIGLRVFVG